MANANLLAIQQLINSLVDSVTGLTNREALNDQKWNHQLIINDALRTDVNNLQAMLASMNQLQTMGYADPHDPFHTRIFNPASQQWNNVM